MFYVHTNVASKIISGYKTASLHDLLKPCWVFSEDMTDYRNDVELTRLSQKYQDIK